MIGQTSTGSHVKDNSNARYNVISDVGTTNNNQFVNMYLGHNALPLALPVADPLFSVHRNNSFFPPKNNPNEYTIGGVLSGRDGIDHHFISTLSVSVVGRYLLYHTVANVELNF